MPSLYKPSRSAFAPRNYKTRNLTKIGLAHRRQVQSAQKALGGPLRKQSTRASIEDARAPDVQNNFDADLGKQLSSRVQSGAIDQTQGEHTAEERALLKRAYGPRWRQKVFSGEQGLMGRTRKTLAEGSTDPNVAALYKKLMENRKRGLERAKAKLEEEGAY